MRVKEESEIAGLKLNIQKTKIMSSSPITLRGKSGSSDRFYFLGLYGQPIFDKEANNSLLGNKIL